MRPPCVPVESLDRVLRCSTNGSIRLDQRHQRKTALEEELAHAVGYVPKKYVITIDHEPHPLRG